MLCQKPQLSPASAAAPKAVVSTISGLSTGMRSRSACICSSTSDTLAPPSARSSAMSQPASCRMASIRSVTCAAMQDSTARAMCARPVPRVMPRIAPRAYMSQQGAPSPVKAGTTTTPPLSGTVAASASISGAEEMMPSSSRSHWMVLPPLNTLPSSA